MGKKSKTPEMPNFQAAAQQQTVAGQQAWTDALRASRANQTTNLGSSTWTQDDKGNWSQNVALNPEQQEIFNKQQEFQKALSGKAGSFLGALDTSQIDFSKAPALPGQADYASLAAAPSPVKYGQIGKTGTADYSGASEAPGVVDYGSVKMPGIGQYQQQATDLYNQLAAPQLQQRRNAAEARLAAMGLNTGSGKAWENAQRSLNDAENQSALAAAQAGIGQGNTMFGQGMQQYQQGVQNLNNQWQQGMAGRQQDVNELNTLWQQGLAGRQQDTTELGQQWQQGMAGRQQGVNELNNLFGQDMQLNQQGIQNILNQRQANMGQLSGMMGMSQLVGTPQFQNINVNPYQVGNYQNAANQEYQGNINKANVQNANNPWNQVGGLVGGLAGSFFGPLGSAAGSTLGKGLMGGGSSYAMPVGAYGTSSYGSTNPQFNW